MRTVWCVTVAPLSLILSLFTLMLLLLFVSCSFFLSSSVYLFSTLKFYLHLSFFHFLLHSTSSYQHDYPSFGHFIFSILRSELHARLYLGLLSKAGHKTDKRISMTRPASEEKLVSLEFREKKKKK